MNKRKMRIVGYFIFFLIISFFSLFNDIFMQKMIYWIAFIICGILYFSWVSFMLAKEGIRALKYLDFYFLGLWLLGYCIWGIIKVVIKNDIFLIDYRPGYQFIQGTMVICALGYIVARVIHDCYIKINYLIKKRRK